MAKKMYVGINDIARKMKKVYVGINGAARKIKKAYIGVGGVARQCYSEDNFPYYYGQLTSLSAAKSYISGEIVGNYVVFAGGFSGDSTYYDNVEAYSSSLVKTIPEALNETLDSMGSAGTSSYALFVGGYNGNVRRGNTNYYNSSLTHGCISTNIEATSSLGSALLNNCGVFAGGITSSGTLRDAVKRIDNSLTTTSLSNLSKKTCGMTGIANSNYGIFAGGDTLAGKYYSYTAAAECFDTSFTKITVSNLSAARLDIGTATIGTFCIFLGGKNDDYLAAVDVYDSSLTHTVLNNLPYGTSKAYGTNLGQYAFFETGYWSDDDGEALIWIYDSSLTLHTRPPSVKHIGGAIRTLNNFAIIGGGYWNSAYQSDVIAYTI